MILSKYNLKKINTSAIELPAEHLFELPEKVLQFGTGVLLRGLPDYFIDKANRNGIFNGRVVVVKSTDTGTVDDFDKQDNLYTIYSKGIVNGKEVSEQIISSAISRVLSAANEWDEILDVARSAKLKVIISNTTEVGIKLVKEDVRKHPPASFPGKLLAVLYERYMAFNGDADSGLVIIPTELIVDNGKKLEAIVLELAHLNKLEPDFMDWLESSNRFCNSLVDRIVPGRPDSASKDELESSNGYTDNLAIMAETYSLWAIEGDDKIKEVLSFGQVDEGVVITPDIELFRELKLRLLNGTHTLCCAFAYLSGFKTVKEAMDDAQFTKFITQLVFEEIRPAIPYKIDDVVAADFTNKVLDRFRNPYIRHEWLSISVQYSTKIKMRVIPLLLNYYKLNNTVPACMAKGFAAFIRFMHVKAGDGGQYIGNINDLEYHVTDSQAAYFAKVWETSDSDAVIKNILKNKDLWDADLGILPGFTTAVTEQFNQINKG
ncbi:tagaturonate reductase [Mucilaginibacter ginsenosidivorax]|uniref:Tagaturonate reductase n=1 Tax=Mucilaginibacter ginsenosidivorax TaxID=862126 RepID=A0A5B8VX29_9SPHI|nr:tagaturonate reductase [Mucilaginibacter ginsenosidivorax]QEC74798.1 tagaturonate reductase [Mucilaginibacter ginsenosidivorax]